MTDAERMAPVLVRVSPFLLNVFAIFWLLLMIHNAFYCTYSIPLIALCQEKIISKYRDSVMCYFLLVKHEK